MYILRFISFFLSNYANKTILIESNEYWQKKRQKKLIQLSINAKIFIKFFFFDGKNLIFRSIYFSIVSRCGSSYEIPRILQLFNEKIDTNSNFLLDLIKIEIWIYCIPFQNESNSFASAWAKKAPFKSFKLKHKWIFILISIMFIRVKTKSFNCVCTLHRMKLIFFFDFIVSCRPIRSAIKCHITMLLVKDNCWQFAFLWFFYFDVGIDALKYHAQKSYFLCIDT